MPQLIWPKDLPESWMLSKISDIAEFSYGKALPSPQRDDSGDFNVYGSGGVTGKHSEAFIEDPTIIVGRKGSVGRVFYTEEPCWCIDTAFYLKNLASSMEVKYLSALLEFIDLSRFSITVGVPGLNREDFYNIVIPVPPLEEQQEIVNILQQAEELRSLRQDSLAKTEKLASASFLEMFGHPISNPKKWNETQRLGQKAEVVSGFTKGRKTQGKSVREVPYLAVANVQDNYLKLENVKSIDATDNEIEKYKLQVNDLLLTEGGDPDKLGRGTLWQEELPECIHQNHIFRVRLTTTDIHPVFLNYLVGSIRGKNYFLRTAKQTTGIASINISQLKAFPLLIPPLDLQERFAQGINSIDIQIEHLKSQLFTLEAFLKALQFQVFSGKLTENWRQLHNDLQASNIKAVHVDASADYEIHSSHKSLYQIQSKRESIYDQLSTFQKTVWDHVIKADVESERPEQAYITADLPRLIADLPDEITTDDQVRLGTTLATLTSLGLIAKVSLPDDHGNYVTAYRAIREEDELSPLQRQVH